MTRRIHVCVAIAAMLLPSLAVGQAPPKPVTPVAPKAEQLDTRNCAPSDTHTTTGRGGDAEVREGKGNLSDKLARSNGVICPPEHVDPDIKQPTPPGGAMPVIPPPGSPGGDPSIQPK